jgi:hypothetical protein
MLLIDRREREIPDDLKHFDIPFTVTELEFGDCMFEGNGPDGTVVVGCERKKLGDFIQSMKDRRLSGHQLRGMSTSYDFIYLFIEGIWRPGRHGEIEELRGRDWAPFYSRGDEFGQGNGRSAISYRQVIAYRTSIETIGNIVVERTMSSFETAANYSAIYHWWQKPWADHKSYDQVHCTNNLPAKGHGSAWTKPHTHDEEFDQAMRPRGRATLMKELPSTLWRSASQLPGIDTRAKLVVDHFETVREMANANCPLCRACPNHGVRDEKEWAGIKNEEVTADGRRKPGIGMATAKAVVRAITEPGA